MAGFVDTTVKEINDRLQELKGEVSKLEAARAALMGEKRGPGRPPGSGSGSARAGTARRTRRSGARRGARGPRGPRGGNTRANQALALVSTRPGITIPELAESLNIQPNYLYRVMPRLVADGKVKRDGQGWHPASQSN